MALNHLMEIATAVARGESDIFGPLSGTKEDQLNALRASYHRLASIVHPDLFTGTPSARLAHETFIRVTSLRDQMEAAIRSNTVSTALARPSSQTASPEPQRPQSSGLARPIPRPSRPLYKERPFHFDDEPAFPPLPKCPCVDFARDQLPYNTVYCYAKEGLEYAVVYEQIKGTVQHTNECRYYRDAHSGATSKEFVAMTGGMIAAFFNGWRWTKSWIATGK